jgi:hypothetical protein
MKRIGGLPPIAPLPPVSIKARSKKGKYEEHYSDIAGFSDLFSWLLFTKEYSFSK